MIATLRDAYAAYDEMLNETCGLVTIGSLTYEPSNVLQLVDPTAYRCGFNDWIDAEGIHIDALYERER